MVERLSEFCNLFFTQTLRVSDEDLVLSLVEGPVDGSHHLSPAGTQSIHGILTVGVVKDQSCFDSLWTAWERNEYWERGVKEQREGGER